MTALFFMQLDLWAATSFLFSLFLYILQQHLKNGEKNAIIYD